MAFVEGFSLKRPFSLSRVGEIASRKGVENRGSLVCAFGPQGQRCWKTQERGTINPSPKMVLEHPPTYDTFSHRFVQALSLEGPNLEKISRSPSGIEIFKRD